MTPFGDRAVRFTLPEGVPRRRLLAALTSVDGVEDVVLTERAGCAVLTAPRAAEAAREALRTCAEAREDEPGALHLIEVTYDGEDLDEVARAIGRSTAEVVALHAERDYRVAMLGFLPGFAYLRGLPDALRLPRRAPRGRVPAGSVAIAGEYTGVYPFASPGGWHLLGRAGAFEPFGARGAALAVGDTVRFVPSPARGAARAPLASPPPSPVTGPHLEITRAAGFALLVDGGRPGRMHEGVPPGGPLVRSAFARANAFAGNAPGACAVELSGTLEVVARGGGLVVADDDGPVALADGERHAVSTAGQRRVRYLAVEGGVDAPLFLGGRGALLVAGVGRLLRRGDPLAPGGAAAAPEAPPEPAPLGAPIAICEGPDEVAGVSLEALTAVELRVSTSSDRTGTRLDGLSFGVDHAALMRASAPMVKGAIELTPSGPIVLGPDHPTTGGYPVVAVVRAASLDALFARPLGAPVRFVIERLSR